MTAVPVHISVNGEGRETRVAGINEKNMRKKRICGSSESIVRFMVCPANGSSPRKAAEIRAAGNPCQSGSH